MPTADFLDWLAGFIDGEGSFQIERNTAKGRIYLVPRFVLGLRDDDAELLQDIHLQTGLGRLERSPARDGQYRSQAQARWVVKRKDDCGSLVALLRAHPLRSKKAKDFETWAAAVEEHAGECRPAIMQALRTQLMVGRRHPNDPRFDPTASGLPRVVGRTSVGAAGFEPATSRV